MNIEMRPKVFSREIKAGDLLVFNDSDYYLIISNSGKKMLLNLDDCSVCEPKVETFGDIRYYFGECRVIFVDDYKMEVRQSSF